MIYARISAVADTRRLFGVELGSVEITEDEFEEYVRLFWPNIRFPLMLDGVRLEYGPKVSA